jgi:hypothetical protein
MGVEQPRDFKKPNTVTSSKYLLQFVVTDYYLLVIWILVAETKRIINCLATKSHNATLSATTKMHPRMTETRGSYLIRNVCTREN